MEAPIVTVIYSHGRFGSPWYGFKIEALRLVALGLGANMISLRYPEEMSIREMERKLTEAVKNDVNIPGDLVFLSSSRGAYLSTRVAGEIMNFYSAEPTRTDDDKVLPKRHVLGQFLIAPAFYIKPEYYPDQNPVPPKIKTAIVHGLDDDVIKCDNSIRYAKLAKAQLYLLEGGHRLNSQRDMLCILFHQFLNDCIEEAKKNFAAWVVNNPQADSQPDNESPCKGRKYR